MSFIGLGVPTWDTRFPLAPPLLIHSAFGPLPPAPDCQSGLHSLHAVATIYNVILSLLSPAACNVFPLISGGKVAFFRVPASSGRRGGFTQPFPPILRGKRYMFAKLQKKSGGNKLGSGAAVIKARSLGRSKGSQVRSSHCP